VVGPPAEEAAAAGAAQGRPPMVVKAGVGDRGSPRGLVQSREVEAAAAVTEDTGEAAARRVTAAKATIRAVPAARARPAPSLFATGNNDRYNQFMSSTWRTATDYLVADLRTVFGDRLRSVCVYGPHAESQGATGPISCIVLVSTLTAADLDACGRAAHSWHRHGLATPLILPDQEFVRSLDAFPLEYAEMQRAHAHVYGADPLGTISIAQDDLRRACETQVKSLLLHLREEYIEAAGRPAAVAELVQVSAAAFAALLRNVARLGGVTTGDRAETTREGARRAGLGDGIVSDLLALEQPSGVMSTDAARLFPEYLGSVEQLARYVDSWRG
jgi:hypothetical protein